MYIVNCNINGFGSTLEDFKTECFDTAKRYLIDIVKNEEDCAETEIEAEVLCGFAEDINLESKPFNYLVLGCCYWIKEE